MSTKTTAKTRIHSYCMLRFFHPTNRTAVSFYCYEDSESFAKKRRWAKTEDREQAYQFEKRDDARRAARKGAQFKEILADGYKWEVVEVQEIEVVTHSRIEEVVSTNASPLIALAKMAGDDDDD